MIEFVTKYGHRFPVVTHNKEPYAITESHGPLRIVRAAFGGGYTVGAEGFTLFGNLRVKAGSCIGRQSDALDITIETVTGYAGVTDCMKRGLPIYYFGVKYRVISASSDATAGRWIATVVPWIEGDN